MITKLLQRCLCLSLLCSGLALAADGDNPLLVPVLTQPVKEASAKNVVPEQASIVPNLPSVDKQEVSNKRNDAETEFQRFVAASVGQHLPIYGYSLFMAAPDTFAPVDRIPVTADYVIGPGDELMINIWGQLEGNLTLVVDRNGVVTIPKIGPVNVAGIQYQHLARHLKNAVGKVYRNFELDVVMGKLRSIQVFVVGQAARPGAYTVSSLSTLVNALFVSGGPSLKGSLRNIQLKRGDQVIREFDVYDLLLKGDKSRDVSLQPGDVIYIPPVGTMAAVAGSVNGPALFELKGNESLADLIALAGGLTSVADGQKVSVERIQDREMRMVDQFELNEAGLQKRIQDGDLVRVYAVSARFDNAVTLRGNIERPGRLPWRDGMRISDLIQDKKLLIPDGYWQQQNRQPTNDGVSLDELRNSVKRSLPEVNWDYAVVERLNPADLTTTLIPFNLAQALIDRDPTQDLLLQAGDVITIFSKNDIKVPVNKRTAYVTLEGELLSPGVYQTQPGETLRQLIARVGGVTPQAYLFGAEFTRVSTRQLQQKRLDEIVDRLEADTLALAGNEDKKEQWLAQQSLLQRMKQVKASGRIVLELPEESADLKDMPDMVLQDGDRLYVPATPSTVHVMGTVYNQNAFVYKPNTKVSDYLDKAGGPTPDGDSDNVYLVRVDGSVISKKQSSMLLSRFGSRMVKPGDSIVVPEKLEGVSWTQAAKDWTQIFYQFAVGVASLKSIEVF